MLCCWQYSIRHLMGPLDASSGFLQKKHLMTHATVEGCRKSMLLSHVLKKKKKKGDWHSDATKQRGWHHVRGGDHASRHEVSSEGKSIRDSIQKNGSGSVYLKAEHPLLFSLPIKQIHYGELVQCLHPQGIPPTLKAWSWWGVSLRLI